MFGIDIALFESMNAAYQIPNDHCDTGHTFGASSQKNVKLKIQDGFFGRFQLVSQDTFVASIIHLGTDRAQIIIPKEVMKGLQVGDRIEFLQIIGSANLDFYDPIQARINWVKDINHAHYLAAECKFDSMAVTVHRQIIQFVEGERTTRGQYCY